MAKGSASQSCECKQGASPLKSVACSHVSAEVPEGTCMMEAIAFGK